MRLHLGGRRLVGVPALAIVVAIAFSTAAQAETATFTYTGAEQQFEVPARVSSIYVEATGAGGAAGDGGAAGGVGALASGWLSVTPGEILYLEVGGPGTIGAPAFNGGATSHAKVPALAGGGGGGASDVRTVSLGTEASPGGSVTLGSRVLVAGGGGGGGSTAATGVKCGASGEGGAAGSSGANGVSCGFPGGLGGGAGGASAGGIGGTSYAGNTASGAGENGALGVGGAANYGGGAGGGLYGGGGGGVQSASAESCEPTCVRREGGAGGGGGGSSLVPAGGSVTLAGRGAAPSIVITYTVPAAACTANRGTITLTPGLTESPAVQTVKVKGVFSGCSGEPFAESKYTATLKTPAAVTCGLLTDSTTQSGAAKFVWVPTVKASTGALTLTLGELAEAGFSGEVSAGHYSPLTFSGTVAETYAGASACGVSKRGRPPKPVSKATFVGSTVDFFP